MKQRPWKTLSLLGLLALSSRGQAWTAVAIPSATPKCDDPCPVHLEYLPVASLQAVPTDLADPEVFAQQTDVALQGRLEALVDTPALQRAIREKRFAAALVDVTDLDQPRLATINGDVMVYAASLPKIAILFGLFEKAEREGLTLDAATVNSATRMIRNSSNPAATEIY
ncbi:MAG: class A beta-lactamase-related serine hydrolase, partial [Gammaproteobacteria bacterium]|nr:class A beta-lactamase-related serine hydrolase [Gammaproteobacteria bacterium]